MAKISAEELLKIAHISQLRLYENEIESLAAHVQNVLSYSECVQEIAVEVKEEALDKAVNVVREDVMHCTDVKPLLALAPQEDHNYFVVPRVIE